MKSTGLRVLLYFLFGVLAALPVSFTQLSSLAFFSFIPALLLFFSDLLRPALPHRGRAYYGYGIAFCMGYFMLTFHWFLSLYPLDFVDGMTPRVAALVLVSACVGLPLFQSLGFAFLFYLTAKFAGTAFMRRHPLFLPFLFAAGWTFFSYTQTWTWMGVPWGAQLALSQQACLPLLSASRYFGSYFVSFLIMAVNACLSMAILFLAAGRVVAERVMALCALSLFLLNLGLGTLSYLTPPKESGHVRAAVLQGNIGSADKWSGEKDALQIYCDLARQAAEEGARVTVWPETAIPYHLAGDPYALATVKRLAKETGSIQIIGSFYYDYTADGDRLRYNSLYLVTPDGEVSENVYHKRHLVPFGEYVPMENVIRLVLPFLADLEMLRDGSTVVPGNSPAIFETEYGNIGGLICFDSIYESLSRVSAAAGAEIFALGTNDSWFLDSAAVYAHNGQAVLRAVENGRTVLRAANTGISSIISPRGEVLCDLAPLVDGYLVADVALSDDTTLYTQIGDIFVLFAFLFFHTPLLMTLYEKIPPRKEIS